MNNTVSMTAGNSMTVNGKTFNNIKIKRNKKCRIKK